MRPGFLRAIGSIALATSAGLSQVEPAGAAVVFNAERPSLIVGANGFGLFAYRDRTNGDLMVGRCVDAACSAVTTSAIDTAGDVGYEASIAAASPGPVIAYEDRTNGRLKLALCADPACSAASTVVVDPALGAGRGLSVAVGTDGRPLVAYIAGPSAQTRLKVAHCDNAACTLATISDLATAQSDRGVDVAIAGNGLGVVAYPAPISPVDHDVAVWACADLACTTGAPRPGSTAVREGPFVPSTSYPSLAIGPDGLPSHATVSITGVLGSNVQYASLTRCPSFGCNGATEENLESSYHPPSLVMGTDDRARLVVHQRFGSGLDFLRCLDGACTSSERSCLTAVGARASLTLDGARSPLVGFEVGEDLSIGRPTGTCAPALAITGSRVAEGTGGVSRLTLSVALGGSPSTTVTVDYATADGTAVAGLDYVAQSGTLTFSTKSNGGNIEIEVTPDALHEGDETFTVVLSNAVGATIAAGTGTGTIANDDALPQVVTAGCTTVEEDAGTHGCLVPVSLVPNGSAQAVTVDFATADGSATAGADYVAATGTLTFPPGAASVALPVSVIGDTVVELDESFIVELSNATNATILDGTAGGTILDDDAPALSTLELTHGSRVTADLAAQPGPVADADHYRLAQAPYASYEVVVDEVSGDLAPGLVVERLAEDNVTVRQTSSPLSTGGAVALRWARPLDTGETRETIRVRSTSCTTACGADDTYRLRFYETTGSVPRFNNNGNQVTVLVLQNLTAESQPVWIQFWDADGALLLPLPYAATVPPRGTLVLNTAGIPTLEEESGSITVAHGGGLGALVGKAVAVEGQTGFSFDSPLTDKPR